MIEVQECSNCIHKSICTYERLYNEVVYTFSGAHVDSNHTLSDYPHLLLTFSCPHFIDSEGICKTNRGVVPVEEYDKLQDEIEFTRDFIRAHGLEYSLASGYMKHKHQECKDYLEEGKYEF